MHRLQAGLSEGSPLLLSLLFLHGSLQERKPLSVVELAKPPLRAVASLSKIVGSEDTEEQWQRQGAGQSETRIRRLKLILPE